MLLVLLLAPSGPLGMWGSAGWVVACEVMDTARSPAVQVPVTLRGLTWAVPG